MKKFLILLFLPTIFGFSNPGYNEKSIILHFQDILNEYRIGNGLDRISLNESIKPLTDERSRDIIVNYNHLEDEKLKEKVKSLPLKFTFAGENIAKVRNIPSNKEPYYVKKYITTNECGDKIEEVRTDITNIMNKMAMGDATNYDIALYCFLEWKYSKDHNDLLLDNKIKRFHLSYEKSEKFYYFCFVALN